MRFFISVFFNFFLLLLNFVSHFLIQQPAHVFQQVLNKLKPEGYFGFTIPLHCPDAEEHGIMTFDPNPILEQLESVGFKIVHQEQFLGYNLPDSKVFYHGVLCRAPKAKMSHSSILPSGTVEEAVSHTESKQSAEDTLPTDAELNMPEVIAQVRDHWQVHSTFFSKQSPQKTLHCTIPCLLLIVFIVRFDIIIRILTCFFPSYV